MTAQTTGMHWQRQKVAAEHFRERLRMAAESSATGSRSAARVDMMAQTAGGSVPIRGGRTRAAGTFAGMPAVTTTDLRGERMEVAVAIGTDPATTFSAIVPAPPEVEEYIIAGFLAAGAGGAGAVRDGRSRGARACGDCA